MNHVELFEIRLETKRKQVEKAMVAVESDFKKSSMVDCLVKTENFAEMCEKLAQSAIATKTVSPDVLTTIRVELAAIREIKSDLLKNKSDYLCFDSSDKFLQLITGFADNLTRAMQAEVEA